MMSHRRVSLRAWPVGLLLIVAAPGALLAQNDRLSSLTAEAEGLANIASVAEMAQQAGDVWQRAEAALSGSELESVQGLVAQAAADRLRQAGVVSGSPIEAVVTLAELAGDRLTRAQREQLLADSQAQLGDPASLSFAQLKDHVERTRPLHEDSEDGRVASRQVVVDWAEQQDPNTLDAGAVDWTMMEMLPRWLSEYPPQEIDATWEARLVAPRTGQYQLAISPLKLCDTRDEGDAKHFRLRLTVEVAGQTVLEATPDSWTEESQPVQLLQGEAVPIRFTMQYRMRGYVPLPAAGQLSWSGPGMGRQLIDPAFYRLPGVDQPGVQLTVQRRDASGTQDCQAVVDRIDQVLGKHGICAHERTMTGYIERRLDQFLSTEFLDQAVAAAMVADASQRVTHPFLAEPDYRGIVNKATSVQRRRMAMQFAQRPELFGPLDVWTLVYFHDAVRFGAEREALDLLGAWLTVHADRGPQLVGDTRSYFDANLAAYRQLTIPLVIEHSVSAQWLEDDYLVTEDGRCSLPAAAVVGYCHLVSGRLLEWIDKLDARLDESTLTGDRRVNWLIARAMAEELRGCPGDHQHYPGCTRLGAGQGWLDEAALVAQTGPVQARVAVERAARYAALGKWPAAEEALQGQAGLDAWRSRLTELQNAAAQQEADDRTAAEAAVLAEMRRRLARANARGDSAAASKYSAVIEELEGSR